MYVVGNIIILHIIFVGQTSSADKNGLVFHVWSLVIISFLFGRLFVFFLYVSCLRVGIPSFIIYIQKQNGIRVRNVQSGRFGTLEKQFRIACRRSYGHNIVIIIIIIQVDGYVVRVMCFFLSPESHTAESCAPQIYAIIEECCDFRTITCAEFSYDMFCPINLPFIGNIKWRSLRSPYNVILI